MSRHRFEILSRDQHGFLKRAKLLYVSSVSLDRTHHSVPHTHACAELLFAVSGNGQMRIGNDIQPICANDMVILNSHVVHSEISDYSSSLKCIVLGVENLEINRSDNPDAHYCILHFEETAPQILSYLQTIVGETDHKAMGYEEVCQELLNILIVLITRQLDATVKIAPASNHNSKEGALVCRYIKEHFRENLDLDMLAEIAHVSKYHLSHTFSKEYGVSPISFMLSLRLQESRELLRTTNFPLSHIAKIAGFSSPSYFSQRFRQAEGISPAQYRRKYKITSNT